MSNQLIDTPRIARPVRTAKWHAGRVTALDAFNDGRFHMPTKADDKQWATGYRETVVELAGTYGRDRILRMGGTL